MVWVNSNHFIIIPHALGDFLVFHLFAPRCYFGGWWWKVFYLRVHRKIRIAIATEACESHSQNDFLTIQRTCLPSRSLMWANSQAPSADTAPCLQHPSPDLPIFQPPYSNSPFKYSPSSNIHNLTCVHLLPPRPPFLRLSPPRLWCWQIQSLRAACSSALMREPASRSTASLSTSWAFCSTPLKRTGH